MEAMQKKETTMDYLDYDLHTQLAADDQLASELWLLISIFRTVESASYLWTMRCPSNKLTYSPYPSSSSFSTGTKRSAAEFMQ